MRTFLFLVFLVGWFNSSVAQDFSNKGKDFWVGYGLHCRMLATGQGGSNTQEMVLYFATEAVTTVKVEVPGVGYSQTYSNIPANTIFTSQPLPKSGSADVRLLTAGTSNLGIHITSDRPVVAYAHIYNQNVSGATLLFPTNTLGKEYYSVNFEQRSNESNSNSFVYAIATDTGTTQIEVVPSALNTLGLTPGVPKIYTLKQGEVFNLLGTLNASGGLDGTDLTGTRIRSVNTTGSGCKRIAVYSGSGKIFITCPTSGNSTSADNYMVQAFPQTAWGKQYLTAPTRNFENNYFRIAVTDPSTVVRVNGQVLTGLIGNFYYQIAPFGTNKPMRIEADKPVMVAQYISSQGVCNNAAVGDPEVIYLSPVEQNIDKVILNSTSNFQITSSFINVIIPNRGTGVSSFRLDGSAPGSTPFTVHPENPDYSYAQISVSAGQHNLQSDSGFNAIAYGYGAAESYGYNAGANVKDLYQFVSVQNQFATVSFPATCSNAPFFFSMTFPYQPLQIRWQFNGLFPDTTITTPVFDSTWNVNGKQLYRYRIAKTYVIPQTGTYPIKVIAKTSGSDGCGGEQEVDYDLQVFDPPKAKMVIKATGCLPDSVYFTESNTTGNRPVIKYAWDLGDGTKAITSSINHLYKTAGDFKVKYSMVTDIGCLSNVDSATVQISRLPVADFKLPAITCMDKPLLLTDASTSADGNISIWDWVFGDNNGIVRTIPDAFTHSYASFGNYTVQLRVKSDRGCTSDPISKTVYMAPLPIVNFGLPENCLSDPFSQFTDSSKIEDGSQSGFTYAWDFGDPNANASNPNIASVPNPRHRYTQARDYNVTLKVTTNRGCVSEHTQLLSINGAVPDSRFEWIGDGTVCSNQQLAIKNNSVADVGKIVRLEIYWDWTGDPTAKTVDEEPVVGKNYNFLYPQFFNPFTKDKVVKVVAYSGQTCLDESSSTIVVKAIPELALAAIPEVCADAPAFNLVPTNINNLPGRGVFSGPGVTPTGSFTPSRSGAGTHTIRYTFTADNSCVNFTEQPAKVLPVPSVNAGPDKRVLEGGQVMLTATASGNGLRYIWSPNNGTINNFRILQPAVSPIVNTEYLLIATSADGCVGRDSVLVTVLKKPVVPNTFSPNGDGINDRWVITYLDTYPGATVEIFNRYGQPVFSSRGYSRPWDGTFNGNPLPAGTYYYIINPKNGREQIAGFVDIVR